VTPRDGGPVTQSRRPHTVYLSADLWGELDRLHLEMRLRTPEAPSKIEFIEQVLTTGMNAIRRKGSTEPDPEGRSGGVGAVEASRAAPEATKTAKGPALSDLPVERRSKPQGSKGQGSPKRPAARTVQAPAPKRAGPLDRLLAASDPGRRPLIHEAGPGPGSGDDR
jgi:hypothetical protein